MLLKYTLEICNIVNPGDQTGFKETLCLKAKNLNILLDKIENPHLRDIYFRADVEMENLAKNFRYKYFKKSKICKYITNTKYNELSKIISKETKANLQLEKNLQKLNARINAQLQKGIQLLSDNKSRHACSLYLPHFEDSSNIKEIMIENMAVSIPQLERQLNEIACESTIAIREMCAYGEFVDCHTIKPALSIFAVEIFITAIFDFGFHHLLGKWPFSTSPIHFHRGESSNTRN
ncbi:hypothetical protein Mgra_00003077 [Meloidogyne graminicola]|uniref:Uncharacterized protein n=1 Tax=Meloidogyne graminicola TaxID=189291 RepID=A0A8S9ZVA3_9BILA|nr:hypothetical protein Mgra_00003077 [Meloidogyne graminicola]